MDMTPMVDVTFLLLIFFMITAAFALQKAIAVPPVDDSEKAPAQSMDELEEDSIVVRVDGDNVFWVFCPSWTEEVKAPSKQDMRNLVRAARKGEAPEGGQTSGSGYSKMLVQASGDATHEFVVAALDAGSGAGVEEIRLVSVEDDF
ncbi:Biopolymer transport protein ExbD/TolR [Botrimarina colliarenosi]|uniref:Biopolymer transport protein ExbD/TolR n=2 Tax=Botrimarina colliarenosi TaxID=2528001 RepID=A0A5C6AFU3_9BACT|nr:Biopolymer transport protein ExbD/TolR [Botrimarina colliarenosi]